MREWQGWAEYTLTRDPAVATKDTRQRRETQRQASLRAGEGSRSRKFMCWGDTRPQELGPSLLFLMSSTRTTHLCACVEKDPDF